MEYFDEPPDWVFTSEEDEVEEQQALDRRQLLERRIEVKSSAKISAYHMLYCEQQHWTTFGTVLQTLIKDRSVLCERTKETDNRVNRLHALADALEHWAAVLAEYNARLGTKRAALQRAHSSS